MKLTTPITAEKIKLMKAGDLVYITGVIYTGRDAAHKRMLELLDKGEELPINIKDQVIYYVGPAPAPPGKPIGSAGPTSAYRMDAYSKPLMDCGLKVMIGKGPRSDEFIKEMIESKGVYLQAVGGVAALLANRVTKAEVVAFHDLGTEAIHRLEVEDFPVVVTYDIHGGNLLKEEIAKYNKRPRE